MSRCLNLTRTGEYAIAALSRLALASKMPNSRPIPVEDLAAGQKIPRTFLSKILRQCAKAGLIRLKKGPTGGASLGRPAETISLLAIIESCEGSYSRDACVFYTERDCEGPACEVYCPLRKEEEALRIQLNRTTLADMSGALGGHPWNR